MKAGFINNGGHNMEEQHYDEISLKELIQSLLRNGKIIVLTTLIFAILALCASLYLERGGQSAQVIVSLRHSSFQSGKTPDGKTFDPYSMVSPHILADVVKSLELEGQLSTNHIRQVIEIDPIIPASFEDRKTFFMEKEGEVIRYTPNEFLLKVNTNSGLGIDESLSTKIANQIVESYMDYFNKEYVNSAPVTNKLLAFDTSEYDYSDVTSVLSSQIDSLKSYLNRLAKSDSDFRSKRTGMAYNDIWQAVDIIDQVDMNRMNSLINAYKLTKDADQLIIYYEYLIEQMEVSMAKAQKQSSVSKDMASKMDSSTQLVIPGLGDNFTADIENNYTNRLILQSASTGGTVVTTLNRIEYFKREIEELKNDTSLVTGREAAEKELVSLIDSGTEKISTWIALTNETADEHFDLMLSTSVVPLSPAEVYSDVNKVLNLAIGSILGLMISVFGALFKEYWEKA